MLKRTSESYAIIQPSELNHGFILNSKKITYFDPNISWFDANIRNRMSTQVLHTLPYMRCSNLEFEI